METPDLLKRWATAALGLAVLLAALSACRSQDTEWPARDPGRAPATVAASPAHQTSPAHASPAHASPAHASPPHLATPHRATWPRPALRQPRGRLPDECAQRRLALAARLGGPAVVWVGAASETDLVRFYQSDDFWYLSGVEIPDVGLALHVDASGKLADEVLFLPAHDPQFEIWNGKRLAPGREAESVTGFRSTAPLDEVAERIGSWQAPVLLVLGAPPAELPAGVKVDDGNDALREALDALRLRKSDYEIDCLANAITITTTAMTESMAAVRPGAFEYEPQGVLEGGFLRMGSERPGFNSIVGSGPNTVTLHYSRCDRQMQDGELLVMDVGAKWKYYTADVTRTVPVNGTFTPRQREVYQAVLDAQTAAAQAARPGVTMHELDAIARKVITDRGFGPGRKYFKHSLGHWIGLYVHDVGEYGPIEPGMLFTIEPGIYINEENLGVRIEDDYLMTADGAVKLSDGFPSDPDEVEALLAGT